MLVHLWRRRGGGSGGGGGCAGAAVLLITRRCSQRLMFRPFETGKDRALASVSGPRGSFGDGRAMRTAVASKFRQSAGDGTLRIGEMRGSHPCAWHSAAATCGAAVALSALASLLGDWGRSPQQAGACLTLWSEVPEENWPFLLKILAMSVMGAGDALAMSPRRLPSFSQPWLAMAFGQSRWPSANRQPEPFFGPISPAFGDFASFQKHWPLRRDTAELARSSRSSRQERIEASPLFSTPSCARPVAGSAPSATLFSRRNPFQPPALSRDMQ